MSRRTFEITLAGQTRSVQCTTWADAPDRYDTPPCFVGYIGQGTETHRVAGTIWHFETAQAARRAGYLPSTFVATDDDGSVWVWQGVGNILNRSVRITGWYDQSSDATSRHIMEV